MISILKSLLRKEDTTGNNNPIECARAIGLLTVCLKAEMSFSESLIIAWRNSKGAIKELFEKSIRNASMGKAASLEESIEQDAKNLPKDIEWVSQPLIDYLRSIDETDNEQRQRMLEKAHENALGSCRQAISDTVSGLRVPFSTIFALGIVLPIIVATILPLWGMISVENIGWDDQDRASDASGSELGNLSSIVLIGAGTILAFPILCIYSSKRFIKKREVISNPGLDRLANRLLIFFVFLGAISLGASFIANVSGVFWLFVGILILLCSLSNRLFSSEKVDEFYDDFIQSPSILNSICGLLLQGEHFIRAVSLSMKESASCRTLFWNSVLGDITTRNNNSHSGDGLRLIEEASNRDPKISARVFRQLSSHLFELEKIENEMRNELRPIAQSAIVATLVLCPFVLGIVAGFNSIGLLSNEDATGFSVFSIIFATFVFEMALNGYWLVKCLSSDGRGLPKSLSDPRKITIISLVVFAISFQASMAIFT